MHFLFTCVHTLRVHYECVFFFSFFLFASVSWVCLCFICVCVFFCNIRVVFTHFMIITQCLFVNKVATTSVIKAKFVHSLVARLIRLIWFETRSLARCCSTTSSALRFRLFGFLPSFLTVPVFFLMIFLFLLFVYSLHSLLSQLYVYTHTRTQTHT